MSISWRLKRCKYENLVIFQEAWNTHKSNEILNFSERPQPGVGSISVFWNQENQEFERGCSEKEKSDMKLLQVHCLWGKYAKPGIVKIQKCQYLQGPVTKIEMVVISFCHATFFVLAEMKACLSTFERGCSEEQNPSQKNIYK